MNRYRRDVLLLTLLVTAASVAAFVYFYRTGQILLYGDAVAHLNIARRAIDSLTPGFRQLGTVWLPLPHVLTIPFIANDTMWRTGIGGSIVSMLAYVIGSVGIFRLVFGFGGRAAAWVAALLYAANPNLLYLQSTAMTESVYLAAMIWAVVYYAEFSRNLQAGGDEFIPGRALWRCGVVLAAAMLTRYDGWFFSGVVGLLVVIRAIPQLPQWWPLRRSFYIFLTLVVLTPASWMAYNFAVFGNPLEFATGPYSARGIAQRTTKPGDPHHPGWHSPRVAHLHFVKAAKLNLAEGRPENWLLLLATAGALGAALKLPRSRAAWLLWIPVPFYALSVAYGSVPIFVPDWWPFSYYNVRYGLQILPAVAVFCGAVVALAGRFQSARITGWTAVIVIALAAVSYESSTAATPISLREAQVNSVTRVRLEERLAEELQKLPAGTRLLMHTSSYVGALQRAGVPLRRTVNEANYRLWDLALAEPANYADYVVAVDGDPVAERMRQLSLEVVTTFRTEGKPPVTIYRTRAEKN